MNTCEYSPCNNLRCVQCAFKIKVFYFYIFKMFVMAYTKLKFPLDLTRLSKCHVAYSQESIRRNRNTFAKCVLCTTCVAFWLMITVVFTMIGWHYQLPPTYKCQFIKEIKYQLSTSVYFTNTTTTPAIISICHVRFWNEVILKDFIIMLDRIMISINNKYEKHSK